MAKLCKVIFMKDYNLNGMMRLTLEDTRRFGMRRRHAWSIKAND